MRKKRIGLCLLTAALVLAIPLPVQAATAQRAHRQTFTILLTSNEGGPVIATGAFLASGVDAESADETTSVFTFPNGTLTIHHESSQNGGTFRFNEVTCIGRFSDSGTYRSTSGTGAYKRTSVSGTYRVRGIETHSHLAGGCGDPVGLNGLIHASGSISSSK
jgi:hypothetical protein